MNIVEAVVLGVLQGIFEWLPVSSEAVISIFMTRLLGSGVVESVNTSIWLHTGTMLAALVYFRRDFLDLLKHAYLKARAGQFNLGPSENCRTILFLTVGTLATGVVGGAIYFLGLKSLAGNPDIFAGLTGAALLVTGLLRFYEKDEERQVSDIDWIDSAFVGVLQGLAIIPGISRSGSTTFGLLYSDFSAREAFRLSFLLSVPAVLAANIVLNITGFNVSVKLAGAAIVSFVVGYFAIDLVLEVADRAEVAYICFILAAISFVPLLL